MTARFKADASVFDLARKTHATRRAMASTALTAVLAVVYSLSGMVQVSNRLEGAPRADTPVLAVLAVMAVVAVVAAMAVGAGAALHAASTPAGRLPGEPTPEGSAAAF